ncbi:MAG TPA: glycosyltransferase family 9 protein [Opitutaceae bacterium]|nr:glycosyltransferase family 9 protein [Opitutaceae bacterium]
MDDKSAGERAVFLGPISGGLLDRAHPQDEARWSALYAAGPLPVEFAEWLATFDLVLNCWPDPDGSLRAKFPRRPGQVFLSAEALPAQAPAAAHYCAPLRDLGLETQEFFYRLEVGGVPRAPDLSFSSFPERWGKNRPPCVAIHPGSGSPAKNWPVERWAALCEWLKTGPRAELLIVTGEADSRSGDLLARFGKRADGLPLRELAARLAACRLFLGHDSGVSHLAAACSVPSVLLFGPTDPTMWAPPARHVRVIKRGPALDSISLAEVQAAVSAALADRK